MAEMAAAALLDILNPRGPPCPEPLREWMLCESVYCGVRAPC
uniref:Uncharacterized protein n=1 Tax=Anguilla anguilla TaxID=7936 RepID=A0A0E9VX99_ANGAN